MASIVGLIEPDSSIPDNFICGAMPQSHAIHLVAAVDDHLYISQAPGSVPPVAAGSRMLNSWGLECAIGNAWAKVASSESLNPQIGCCNQRPLPFGQVVGHQIRRQPSTFLGQTGLMGRMKGSRLT